MSNKYYLDTCIWRDYYDDRKDPSKDIGEYAFRLLCKLLVTKSKIIVSSYVQQELEVHYSLDQIRSITVPFKKIIEKIEITDNTIKEAKTISKSKNIPFGDVLHAILARNAQAIMVTRDKHFQLLKDICQTLKPEDII